MGESDRKPVISVIVPVYKVEPYLHDCVDSILAQTYTELEIILVDDGSPDNCPAICDEYAKKDSRIKVIHKDNGGLSDARNAGLAVCSGEYLMFVDSDDLLFPNAVQVLYDFAFEYGAQLVIGGHVRFENESKVVAESISTKAEVMNTTEAMKYMFTNGCASWARLYRSSVHKNVLFPCGEINEDEAIVLSVLENCKRTVITEQVVYLYRLRSESITTSDFSIQKLDWYRHCKANLEWIRTHHPELTDCAAARYRSSILWSLTEMAMAEEDYGEKVENILSELRNERKILYSATFNTTKEKFLFIILCHVPFRFYRFFGCIVRRVYEKKI